MKFRDLGAQYNRLKEEIDKASRKSFQMGILLGEHRSQNWKNSWRNMLE